MEIFKLFKDDKIKINWNKNPIPMSLFLSFLTLKVEKNTNHLGASTGWTQYRNDEKNLIISGGICDGDHWLDSLQYGNKLANQYNNFVNPFYLFDVMTDEGKAFFVKYYEDEINKALDAQLSTVNHLLQKSVIEFHKYDVLKEESEQLKTFK